MLLPDVLQLIHGHAEELARDLMADLRRHPATTYLHGRSDDDLRQRALRIYAEVAHWLGDRDATRTEAFFREIGQRRSDEHVPLAELVFAIIRMKQHLWDFISRNVIADTALEIYQVEEVVLAIGRFFDDALYHAVKGYEDARTPGARRFEALDLGIDLPKDHAGRRGEAAAG